MICQITPANYKHGRNCNVEYFNTSGRHFYRQKERCNPTIVEFCLVCAFPKKYPLVNEQSYQDRELLQQIAEGDDYAFRQLYDRYFPAIFLYVRNLTCDQTLAEDITSEAFIALWKGQRHFDTLGHVVAFLRRVAHNKCVDELRISKRASFMKEELLYLNLDSSGESAYQEIFIRGNILARIRAEVEMLPPATRAVFKLAFYQQMKNPDIARNLSITDASVRRRKTEALHHLRNVFKGTEWELVLIFLAGTLFFQNS